MTKLAEIFDMTETLELFRPTEIEIDKGIRYLRSLGLPNIGITVQGDVYNSDTKRYLNDRKQYIFNVNNKSIAHSKNYLIKVAFKYDVEDPSKVLDLKDKDLETDVYMTWDFWNKQKNYLLTDLLDPSSLKLSKNEILNFRYNSIGLYNIKYERYANIDAKGLYQISIKRNGNRTKFNIIANKLQDNLKSMTNSSVPMINEQNGSIQNEILNISEPVQPILKKFKLETVTDVEPKTVTDTDIKPKIIKEKTEIKTNDINPKSKHHSVDDKNDNKAILEFINDTLTMSLDELSVKYNVAKQILKTIKNEE